MVRMYYCSVLRPPLECVLDPLYIPIPIPRYMHANFLARAASLCSTYASLDPRLSRAPARKESLASFEGFLGFFERTLNDVMRDCHVTNTRFRSGFPFCLCVHAHMHIPYRQLHSSWTLNRPAVDIRSRHSSHYQWEVKRIHLGPKQIVLSLGAVLLSEVCTA